RPEGHPHDCLDADIRPLDGRRERVEATCRSRSPIKTDPPLLALPTSQVKYRGRPATGLWQAPWRACRGRRRQRTGILTVSEPKVEQVVRGEAVGRIGN